VIGVALDDEPLRAVTRAQAMPRPRGGFVVLTTLECGHAIWRRVRREPTGKPRPVRCTACWLARVLPPREDVIQLATMAAERVRWAEMKTNGVGLTADQVERIVRDTFAGQPPPDDAPAAESPR
jgi:hypothetical protein